jgi:hypothetical protein
VHLIPTFRCVSRCMCLMLASRAAHGAGATSSACSGQRQRPWSFTTAACHQVGIVFTPFMFNALHVS